jgi:hypothetical protein
MSDSVRGTVRGTTASRCWTSSMLCSDAVSQSILHSDAVEEDVDEEDVGVMESRRSAPSLTFQKSFTSPSSRPVSEASSCNCCGSSSREGVRSCRCGAFSTHHEISPVVSLKLPERSGTCGEARATHFHNTHTQIDWNVSQTVTRLF